ncbi:hypothetical protein FGM00_13630 [Aggregatimonas sangjinii]|uniref:Uncharacterized protein n=1 Tax=Aggregatimonas sangjinii TaxID=2583587 RepID=A0A5B7SWN0_9FLAO|nr:hypothetical protein [Aggregatimonas sangjinii]QCX01104.1 hypothetical protein FGM00_13630 [Aggregatimonas sangjinii]
MKCAEYYLDNHKVEIYATLFGKEVVMVNNKPISELKSSARKSHHFKLGNNTYDIRSKLNIAGPSGKAFEIYKNGEELTLVNFKVQSSRSLLFLIIVLGIALGYIVGIYLYQAYPIAIE